LGAAIGLACFRIAYVKLDQEAAVDVGIVSVQGANRIAEGRALYEGPLYATSYGPTNYLLYLPFERAAKWSGKPPGHAGRLPRPPARGVVTGRPGDVCHLRPAYDRRAVSAGFAASSA
jgi:hypothetical protein